MKKVEPEQEVLPPVKPGALYLRAVTMAHVLTAALLLADQSGIVEVNPSNTKVLNKHMEALLSNLDVFTQQRVARHAVAAGDMALSKCEAPNEVTRVLAVAYATMKMAEEQLIDPASVLVATALCICMEAEDPQEKQWGSATRPKHYADLIARTVNEELRGF